MALFCPIDSFLRSFAGYLGRYLQCNKISHYDKYYHYVENCLFTPIDLPRILSIELTDKNDVKNGGKLWQQFQIKF
jgi:hypothetical protein